MRGVTSMIIILFSLLVINGEEYQCIEREESFIVLEQTLYEEFKFDENGIKIEYEIKTDKNKELLRLEELSLKDNNTVIKEDNNINILNSDYSVEIKVFKDIVDKVQIIILNKDKKLSINELRQVLNKYTENYVEEYREYLYVKIKVDKNIEDMNEVYNRLNIREIEILEIDNGKAIKGTLNDNTKVNLGEINYNTEKYLIIGTPVIFTEY